MTFLSFFGGNSVLFLATLLLPKCISPPSPNLDLRGEGPFRKWKLPTTPFYPTTGKGPNKTLEFKTAYGILDFKKDLWQF